jgi:hypothetical protein
MKMIRCDQSEAFASLLQVMHDRSVHHLTLALDISPPHAYASPITQQFLFRWSGGEQPRPVLQLKGRGTETQGFPPSEPVSACLPSSSLLVIRRENPNIVEMFAGCSVAASRLPRPLPAWPGPGDDPKALWSARFGLRTPLLVHQVTAHLDTYEFAYVPKAAIPSLEDLQRQGTLLCWFPHGVAAFDEQRRYVEVYWRCEGEGGRT